jgi:hypothetical protein
VGKWLAGIAATVIAALLIWWVTKPAAPYSVDGLWKYKMTSKSGGPHQGTLRLTMSGSQVTGILEDTFDKTSSGVTGQFANNTLELTRDTWLDGRTTQNYRLTKEGPNRFAGTFWNVGRWPDEGAFEIDR